MDPNQAVTYDEAVSQCESENMRLCTQNELFADVCCETGGGCDKRPVWTSTGSGTNFKINQRCKRDFFTFLKMLLNILHFDFD